MEYCVVNTEGIIENIIVCDTPEIATMFGAVESYDGAVIGELYKPPEPEPSLEERILLLEAQNKALTQSNQFFEDCLVEMAGIIYA